MSEILWSVTEIGTNVNNIVTASVTNLPPSWPGLSRPSTAYFAHGHEDVDARDKRGHDD
jgi:hypothetical protein